jgi:hypothetical protein
MRLTRSILTTGSVKYHHPEVAIPHPARLNAIAAVIGVFFIIPNSCADVFPI